MEDCPFAFEYAVYLMEEGTSTVRKRFHRI